MSGAAVAEVIESNHPDWNIGDFVETFNFGWQEYAALDVQGVTRVDSKLGHPHAWLSYLGMPGITAWCALNKVGKPKAGETVLISAASGAVGQVAGQIAKATGCHAVAVASTQSKLDWCLELGYDEGINYRTSENLLADISNLVRKESTCSSTTPPAPFTTPPCRISLWVQESSSLGLSVCRTSSISRTWESDFCGRYWSQGQKFAASSCSTSWSSMMKRERLWCNSLLTAN